MKKTAQKKNIGKAASKAVNKKAQKKAARKKASADKVSRQRRSAQQTLATMAAIAPQEAASTAPVASEQEQSGASTPAKAQPKTQQSTAKKVPTEQKADSKVSLPASSAPSVQTPKSADSLATPKKSPKKTENIMAGNRKALCYYLAIFICLILFEAHRFSLYLEDKSADYPEFTFISEVITYVGENTGLNSLMNTVGEFTSTLSEEQIIESQTPWDEQWFAVWQYYKNALGFSAQEEETVAEKKVEPKEEQPAVKESKKVAEKEDVKEQKKIIEKPKEDPSKVAVEKPTKKAEIKKPSEPQKEVTYAFYDPEHISSAPSERSLEIYTTKLPDFGKKIKVLLVGDSMMQGLVPLIQNSLKHRKDIEVAHRAKVSTGLANQTFFNWPDNLKKLLKQHDPDVTIVFIGANDPQHLKVNKRWFGVDTDGWRKIYSLRTLNFLELATAQKRKVVWIGLPMMLKEPYAKRIKVINKVYKDVNAFYSDAAFVDTEMLLTDKGKYISFITGKNNKTIRLRQKDNIHLTFAGGRMITEYMIPTFDAKVQAVRLDEVQGNPLIPIPEKANTITFTSHTQNKNVEYIAYLPMPLTQEQWEQKAKQDKKKTQEKEQTEKSLAKASPLWNVFNQVLQNPSAHNGTNSVPVGIVAVQKNAKAPSSVSKLIAQSLQAMPQMTVPTDVKADIPQEKKGNNASLNASSNKIKFNNEKFPVLYLLHGAQSSGKDWNTHMGKELQKIANEKRVIIVAPTAGEYNWYVNSPIQKSSQMESFILKELVPHVDMLFPTTGQRAIAGLSMGGHGAMLLGLKHPKTFQSVASASGVLDIRLHPDSWQLSKVLGAYAKNKKVWDNNSVAYILEKKAVKSLPKQILITTGLQDTLVLEDNKKVHDLIQKKKLHCEYEEIEGNHDWEFWSKQFTKLLRKQADFIKIKQS